ncbi:MAG TPA: hypothetical protein VNT92_00380 [Acidimicrobiia bacterium]|nr:hypothetical protein [Acidimicrobiia bacterium]
MNAGKVILAILGAILGLVAAALVTGGVVLLWAHGTQRTSDGFYEAETVSLSTDTYAVVTGPIDLVAARPTAWFPTSQLATLRFEANSTDAPVFIGIGPEGEVGSYLDGVGVAEVIRSSPFSGEVTYDTVEGDAPPGPPGEQDFWVASAEGERAQSVTWDLESGEWTGVIMNADGSAGVSADFNAGAQVGILLPVSIGMVLGGLVLGVLAVIMLVLAIRQPRATVTVRPASTTESAQEGTTEATPPPNQGSADPES